MDNKVFDDIEIAPPSVVKQAARDFAADWLNHRSSRVWSRRQNTFDGIQSRNRLTVPTRKSKSPGVRS